MENLFGYLRNSGRQSDKTQSERRTAKKENIQVFSDYFIHHTLRYVYVHTTTIFFISSDGTETETRSIKKER